MRRLAAIAATILGLALASSPASALMLAGGPGTAAPAPPAPRPSIGNSGRQFFVNVYPSTNYATDNGLVSSHLDGVIGYVNRYEGFSGWGDLGGAFAFNTACTYKTAISVTTIMSPVSGIGGSEGGGTGAGTDMVASAAGSYNTNYQAFANSLIPYSTCIEAFVINWEFQGWWLYHGVANSDGSERWTPSTYINSFRQMATILKATLPQVPIAWTPNNILNAHLPAGRVYTDYYPGDDVVDIIAMDIYEQNFTSTSIAFSTVATSAGLDDLVAMASAHGNKYLSLPEVAATANDGAFITGLNTYARAHKFWHITYWDSTDAGISGAQLSTNPAEKSAFISSFSDAYGGPGHL